MFLGSGFNFLCMLTVDADLLCPRNGLGSDGFHLSKSELYICHDVVVLSMEFFIKVTECPGHALERLL